MVRFVPPAPLDAATLGGAFFMPCVSNQYHAKAKRRNSSAVLCVSLPLLIRATRAFATPLQHFAELFLCISMRVSSIALPSNAVQFTSLLFRCFSGPCYSLPMLCYASHRNAIPLLIKGIPCHSTSEPVEATPLLITAILRHHISSQDLSPHCRC